MAKQNDKSLPKQGNRSSNENNVKKTTFEGKAVALSHQAKQPAAIPPKMESKPPKK